MDRTPHYALLTVALLLSASATALQDPTRPTDPAHYFGTGQNASDGAWALQSILSSPGRRIAVINGERVREGDPIGAARVIRIHESHVLLDTGGRTLTLRLLPQTIRVRP